MDLVKQKRLGAYYTPDFVVRSLVKWVVRKPTDRMLDPACGDGRFLASYANSVGVEHDPDASAIVHQIAPGSLIHEGDFFAWANQTHERFECAAGNPPFIRYQRFTGSVRDAAQGLCSRHGVHFSSLSSSWAPFIVASATLLKPGGRMAFVVPAEIGHAPYAKPVMEYLIGHFDRVQVIAVQRKLFPELSEDCWLVYAQGYGGQTEEVLLSPMSQFGYISAPPPLAVRVSVREWRAWNSRLRSFLLPKASRDLYQEVTACPGCVCLRDAARVGIGYVTGANQFFHLRPSEAAAKGIPDRFLQPTVRNGKCLSGRTLTTSVLERWRRRDDPMLLLRLKRGEVLPRTVRDYLDTPAGQEARTAFKCRTRNPWYAVPDVSVPDGFLTYMSTDQPALVANKAPCAGTNSVHLVRLNGTMSMEGLQRVWQHPFTRLSCEVEGHPLGGGMLKLEPNEAGSVALPPRTPFSKTDLSVIREGTETLRRWRHHVEET